MRKLTKPIESAKEVFETCISSVRNNDLKRRLETCIESIVSATEEFEVKVVNANLHSISVSDNVAGIVTSKEMEKVYTSRMVGKKSPGRNYYDKLMTLPKYGRCPLCGQRDVSTLDHHLPKTEFPALAVSLVNLIPSCKDCNFIKKSIVPKSGNEETLHPYYDDVESEIWLKADIIEEIPASIVFYVDAPSRWSTQLTNRVKYHFRIFKLAQLYSSHAAEEIINIAYALKMVFDSGGADSTRILLEQMAESKAEINKNSWQTALYVCLSENDWFCQGGFSSDYGN